ncbi:MAG: septal ring lytic transglycosylase RlpA family protein [Alphaproteobacteria bacterium]|nr:septal ring lytic transglycosylase RlpA family protein [Alphaproteobacteria bacterium]
MIKYLKAFLLLSFVAGCASHGTPELSGMSPKAQAVVIKQYGGLYKVGNPYQIMGRWYYQKEDYQYSEIGIASWYGDDFHAKRTANGEKYDMNTLTAAHRTLPLPSIVRVTNLENGRSLVLRVNDRGPYAKERIIDISKRGAQLLGYQTKGTAKVKVEIMEEESKALKAALLGQDYQKAIAVATLPSDVNNSEIVVTGAETKSATSKKHFIQAGSFRERDLALKFEKKLKKFGATQIVQADVNGTIYYRVRLGPITAEDVAQDKLLNIQSSGFHDARIVKE